jgi:mono/diheme cytochrome c family protein
VRRLALILVGTGLLVAGCGSEGTGRPLPTKVVGTIETTPTEKGNAAAGKGVFTSIGCGSCHTFAAAGTKGTVGPNLDDALKGKDAGFVRESIVNPNAEVAKGYAPNLMPQTYGSQLSDQQLADLVSFLTEK